MFEIELDYAVASDSLGNILQLEFPSGVVDFPVETTGSWDQYRKIVIGKTKLPAGEHKVIAHSKGAIHNALIDLRKIQLKRLK